MKIVNKVPVITLYFKNEEQKDIIVSEPVRGVRNSIGQRPIGISWKNIPNGYKVDDNLKDWLFNELSYAFDKNVNFNSKVADILRLEK